MTTIVTPSTAQTCLATADGQVVTAETINALFPSGIGGIPAAIIIPPRSVVIPNPPVILPTPVFNTNYLLVAYPSGATSVSVLRSWTGTDCHGSQITVPDTTLAQSLGAVFYAAQNFRFTAPAGVNINQFVVVSPNQFYDVTSVAVQTNQLGLALQQNAFTLNQWLFIKSIYAAAAQVFYHAIQVNPLVQAQLTTLSGNAFQIINQGLFILRQNAGSYSSNFNAMINSLASYATILVNVTPPNLSFLQPYLPIINFTTFMNGIQTVIITPFNAATPTPSTGPICRGSDTIDGVDKQPILAPVRAPVPGSHAANTTAFWLLLILAVIVIIVAIIVANNNRKR
jgi:hypothetical protein